MLCKYLYTFFYAAWSNSCSFGKKIFNFLSFSLVLVSLKISSVSSMTSIPVNSLMVSTINQNIFWSFCARLYSAISAMTDSNIPSKVFWPQILLWKDNIVYCTRDIVVSAIWVSKQVDLDCPRPRNCLQSLKNTSMAQRNW